MEKKKCEGLFLQDITCFANKPPRRSFGDPRMPLPGGARSAALALRSPHRFHFWVAQHDMLQFICHFRMRRSGQNGAIQPTQLKMLLLTDRYLECNTTQEAAVTFKSCMQNLGILSAWTIFNFTGHFFWCYQWILFYLHHHFLLMLQEWFPVLPDTVWLLRGSLWAETWACTGACACTLA